MSTAAAEEPAVPGALHLPHPLQRIPTSREEKLLAALLCSLDGTGTGFSPPLHLFLYTILSHFVSPSHKTQTEMTLNIFDNNTEEKI